MRIEGSLLPPDPSGGSGEQSSSVQPEKPMKKKTEQITKWLDHRMLPICTEYPDGRVLLPHVELKGDELPVRRRDLPGFDIELEMHRLTGQSGLRFDRLSFEQSEALLGRIRTALKTVNPS